jgi:hypothetical protein
MRLKNGTLINEGGGKAECTLRSGRSCGDHCLHFSVERVRMMGGEIVAHLATLKCTGQKVEIRLEIE